MSIIDSLSQSVFQRKIKKIKNKQQREKKFLNYDRIRSILLLYESDPEERNLLIEAIKKGLIRDKKKVTMCGFVNKKHSVKDLEDGDYMIDTSHTGLFKEPQKQLQKEILNKKYDLVLDLTLKEVLPLQYILAYSKSPFKVGRKVETEDVQLLDFMIDMSQVAGDNEVTSLFRIDEDYLFRQIIFYLKSIKSNN